MRAVERQTREPVEILVVEDSLTQAEQLAHMLQQNGYHATVAHNGGEALELLAKETPALVLSDIVMPGMDGYELCRRIKTDDRTYGLPVVLVTSLADPGDVVRGLECGADNFIVKPYREEELLDRIEYILVNRRLGNAEKAEMGVDIVFAGQRHFITSGRLQILNLLLTTYDTAVRRNGELEQAREDLQELNARLEERVRERTADLTAEIVERKRAEAALRETEDRFRYVFEHSIIGKALTRPNGEMQVNRAFAEMLGYSLGEMNAKRWQEISHPHEVADTQRVIGSLLCGERELARFTRRYIHKDGSVVWADVATSLRRDETGAPLYFMTSVSDITERRRAEEVRNQLAAIVECSTDAIIGQSLNGRVVSWNAGAERLYGYRSAEVVGTPISILAPPGRAHEIPAILERIRVGDQVASVETERVAKDGRLIPVSLTVSPVLDASGAVIGASSIAHDLTRRKRAEEALRRSEERFRALVQNSTDMIAVLLPDGNVSYVGPSVKQVVGYEPEDLVGRRITDLVHPEDLPSVLAAIQRVVSVPGATETVECRMRDVSGSWRVIETTGTNLLDNPAVEGLVVHSRDISERRRAEEQLRHAQKMESIGSLAGGVAHDFNNILQALLSITQLLRAHRAEPKRFATSLEELEQHVKRGAALTRQLLLFARREVGKPERLDLNEAVSQAAKLLRRLVRENIAFTVEAGSGTLPIEADRGQLDQVLMNLVVNARDAMPDGGELVIRTGRCDDREVFLEVQDTGVGMSEELQGKIFDPFFTTKGANHGTGLGLAVVHGIVTQHGGRIEVRSEPGKGSTFRVVLPRRGSGVYPAVREEALVPAALPQGRGERVLVVEDEEGARAGLKEILTMLGYDVVALGSGEEAGLLPAEPGFDVLLTDLLLPGVHGPELARGLKERWPDLKVVLMSGYTEDEVVPREVRGLCMHFLQKPFDMETLARELRAALDREGR